MFGDIGKLMKMVGEMKTKVPAMRAKLEASEYVAHAGGGAVSATVNGKLGLVDLKIAPSALTECASDAGMIEDMIKAAVSAAQAQAAEAASLAMKELTGGIELPPGMGL